MPFTSENARIAGKKGGDATKRNMLAKDPNYYSRVGFKGGMSLLEQRGIEHFSTIGKMGISDATKEKRRLNSQKGGYHRWSGKSLLKERI